MIRCHIAIWAILRPEGGVPENKKSPDRQGDVSNLITELVEEATREDVPPRLRELALQLEAALARRRQAPDYGR